MATDKVPVPVTDMIPEMLTLEQTSKRSGLSYDALRKMCLNNKIVYIRVGKKFLINWNRFVDYLNGELADDNKKEV